MPVAIGLTERHATKATFQKLAARWRLDRSKNLYSSVQAIAMHPAYQRIIGFGPDAVPLILAELEREPDHWFWALHAITGAQPVPAKSRGNIDKMAKAWVAWGKKHGYKW
jgi:hypothetical protein